MSKLGGTRLTPDALTAAGVTLCIAGSVAVYFEYKGWGWFWVGAALFVLGSILDILDGALARSQNLGSEFGAFIDSTVDRIGEGFMLGAIALVLRARWARMGRRARVRRDRRVVPRSYTRAKAEALGLKGDVGFGSRAERVVVITTGLVLAPLSEYVLLATVAMLVASTWITVLQRVLAVRTQLRQR